MNNIIKYKKIQGFSTYGLTDDNKLFDLFAKRFTTINPARGDYKIYTDNGTLVNRRLSILEKLTYGEFIELDISDITVNWNAYPVIDGMSHYKLIENDVLIDNTGYIVAKQELKNDFSCTVYGNTVRLSYIKSKITNEIADNLEPKIVYLWKRINPKDRPKMTDNSHDYEKVDISKLETFAQSDLFPQRIEQELINKLAQQSQQLTFVETDKTIGAKYIPNTNNRYIVTKTGVIYDLSKNKIIKPHQLVHNKYANVQIYINNKLTSKHIHILMAQSWIMEDYIERGYVCKHLDNNKHNYNLENLMIDSNQNNIRDAVKDGLISRLNHIGENGKSITSDTILYKIDGLSNYGFDNENGVIYDLNTGISKPFMRDNTIMLIDDNNLQTRLKMRTIYTKCKLSYKNIPYDAVLLKDIKPKDTNKTQEDFKYNYYLTKSGDIFSTFDGKQITKFFTSTGLPYYNLYGKDTSLPKLMIETFVYKNYSSHIPKLWITFINEDKTDCSLNNLKISYTKQKNLINPIKREKKKDNNFAEMPKDAVAIPLSYLDNKYYITKDAIVYSTPKGNHNGIILKHSISSKGYVTVSLSGKNHRVHQLMAITFLDKDYKDKGLVVGHKDKNKLNNKLSNLYLITVAQNNKDAREHREQFAEIMGYSRYRLTNDERVYDLLLQTYVSNANKNQSFRLYKDDGKISNLKIKSILNLVTPYSYKNLTNADMEYFLNNKDLQIGIIFDKYMVCKNRMVLDINAKLPILPTKNNYFKLINEKNELVSFRINQLIDMIQTKNIPNTPNTPNTHDINSSDTTTDWITLNDDRFNGYQVKLDNGEVKVLGLRYNKEIKPRSKTSFRLKNNTIKIDTIKELILAEMDK